MFKHGFPPEWSTFKKLIWLVGSGIAGAASGIWKTVTGTLIHITDALASPMQKCEVTLEPIQDLHGQDAPYPAGGGVNKFGDYTVANGYIPSSGTITAANDNRTFVIKAKPSTNYAFLINRVPLSASSANDDYAIAEYSGDTAPTVGSTGTRLISSGYVIPSGGSQHTVGSGTFTTAATTQWIAIKLANTGRTDPIATANNTIVVEGTTVPTEYSPYSNICPITGWTGCEVNVTGQNLFDADHPELVTVSVDGNDVQRHGHKFAKAGKYAIKAYGSSTFSSYLYAKAKRSNGTWTNDYYVVAGTSSTPYVIEILEGTELYIFNVQNSGEETTIAKFNAWKIQVAYSETQPDSYSAYSGTTLSVTFPDGQTVYGGKPDLVSGKMTVDRALKIFDGSETWYEYSSFSGFYTNLYGMKVGIRQDGISNMLVDSKTAVVGKKNAMWLGVNSAYFFAIGVYETMGSTLEEFKSFLSTHPLQVVYPLTEPIEIQLTPQEISTLKGVNNVRSNSNGDTTVIYKAQAE